MGDQLVVKAIGAGKGAAARGYQTDPTVFGIDNILKIKDDSDALIIYAPQEEGLIDRSILEKINLERNSIVVNFRGRLLNDILTCMITTSYVKK